MLCYDDFKPKNVAKYALLRGFPLLRHHPASAFRGAYTLDETIFLQLFKMFADGTAVDADSLRHLVRRDTSILRYHGKDDIARALSIFSVPPFLSTLASYAFIQGYVLQR